jgi:hypothetical protein
MTSVSSSADTVEKFQISVPTVDDGMSMTATELHKALRASLVGTLVCHAAAKNLAVAAKRRMQAGEPVGGCLTFTGVGGYVDKFVRQEGQSLEAANRASYRLLDGLGISEKFDGSVARAANKKKAEEKAKKIADKKESKAKDKAARLKLDEKARKAKSLKDKNYIEILEAEIDKLKTTPQAEAAAKPTPVTVTGKNFVNADVAARDANDLDAAVLLLQSLVFAVKPTEKKTVMQAAIKFLKYKEAFVSPSVAKKPAVKEEVITAVVEGDFNANTSPVPVFVANVQEEVL